MMSHDIHRTFNSFHYTIKKGIVSNFDIFFGSISLLYTMLVLKLLQITPDTFPELLFNGDQTLAEILRGMIGIIVLI